MVCGTHEASSVHPERHCVARVDVGLRYSVCVRNDITVFNGSPMFIRSVSASKNPKHITAAVYEG